jgi:hypothetical protein
MFMYLLSINMHCSKRLYSDSITDIFRYENYRSFSLFGRIQNILVVRVLGQAFRRRSVTHDSNVRAMVRVSHEMGHERGDIREHYLRGKWQDQATLLY